MKKTLIFFVLSVLLSLTVYGQEKSQDKERQEFIDYFMSWLNDDFKYRIVAFKIQAYNSDEVYIYSNFFSALVETYIDQKSWDKERFIEYFTPIIFHDEILIVDEDMMDGYFKSHNIKFEDCTDLYNWEKEDYLYVLLNTDIGDKYPDFFDCFIYKCLKHNVLPVTSMLQDGPYLSVDNFSLNHNAFLTHKDVLNKDILDEMISKLNESPEEYEKFIHYVLSKPYLFQTGYYRYVAFKIQSYKGGEVYLFSTDVYSLFRAFRKYKKWDEKKFREFFFNLLINDDIYIVDEDMENYFFEWSNDLLADCDSYYNFNSQKEFYDLILNSDFKTNRLPYWSCLVYKGLKNYTFLGLTDSEYLILVYPFSE